MGRFSVSGDWSQDERLWGAMDNETRLEEALQEVARIHPRIREEYELGAVGRPVSGSRPRAGRLAHVELAFMLALIVSGFLIGGLARFAVPGPDPMPIWLTIAIGILGALLGGLVAQLFLGDAGSFVFAFAGAVLVVIAYRRFAQGRGITGPEAKLQPTRGLGIRRRPRT